jgi:hypothetical protein
MSATCAITDKTGQWGESSIMTPRVAVEPNATNYADQAAPTSSVDGADLLQFLRVAYAPPQTEAEVAAQLSGDLVEFLRDFSSTAPRPMIAGMTGGDYQAPRRVLLAEGTGRRRAPVALASLAAASSLRALHPATATQLRVPPYVAELSGRGWIVGSGREVAEAAS